MGLYFRGLKCYDRERNESNSIIVCSIMGVWSRMIGAKAMEDRFQKAKPFVFGLIIGSPILQALFAYLYVQNKGIEWETARDPLTIMLICALASLTLSICYLIINPKIKNAADTLEEIRIHMIRLCAFQIISLIGLIYFVYQFSEADNVFSYLLDIFG
jgi:hypothetical protein